jgi:TetR/AcrR family transcriptional regulator
MTSELANPTASFDVVVKKYILQIFTFLSVILQEGATSGIFRDNLNVWFTTVFLTGIMNFFFIAKSLLLSFAPLPELADEACVVQAVDIFLYGFVRRDAMNKN